MSLYCSLLPPSSRPALASSFCASDTVLPLRSGTSFFWAPLLTISVILVSTVTFSPAAGFVPITTPFSHLSLYSESTVKSVKPCAFSVFFAASSSIPSTLSIVTSFSPELITTSITVFFATFSPASILCRITVFSGYSSEFSLLTTSITRLRLLHISSATSLFSPTNGGTSIFLLSVSTASVPGPNLNTPAALPITKIRMKTMITATTIVRIFIILFILGLTSLLLLPFRLLYFSSSSSSYPSSS